MEVIKHSQHRDCPGGPVTETPHSQCRGPRFDPWLGTRSHMPQLKIPHTRTKTWCSQINKRIFLKKHSQHIWHAKSLDSKDKLGCVDLSAVCKIS